MQFDEPLDAYDLSTIPTTEELHSLEESFSSLRARIPSAERQLPIVIEFLGPPKAYKTTVRDMVAKLLDNAGLEPYAPPEGASIQETKSFRENLVAFNSFTGTYAFQHLLRATHPANKYHVALFDRGLFDAQCWIKALEAFDYLDKDTASKIRSFFGLRQWTKRIDALALFSCSPAASAARADSSSLSAKKRLATSDTFLEKLNHAYKSTDWLSASSNKQLKILHVDTSSPSINVVRLAFRIAERIGALLESAVDPEYAAIPSASVRFTGFLDQTSIPDTQWRRELQFVNKSHVETDSSFKQLVAYAFIEIDGMIFRAHRTGTSNRPELRNQLTIGFGGHVERSDCPNGESLEDIARNALIRELEEELIFDAEPDISLVGWINDESTEAGLHHIAAVHRVRLAGGRVRIRPGVLDQEFGEKSWATVKVDRVIQEHAKFDPWSRHIIASCLGGPSTTEAVQQRIKFNQSPSQTIAQKKRNSPMAAKYELKKSANDKFMFNLKAGNGEVILTSEMYEAKASAENGIASVQKNAADDANYDRRESKSGEPYFVLKAANHEIIGRSEMYSSKDAMENGITSVKANGPEARIEDLTA